MSGLFKLIIIIIVIIGVVGTVLTVSNPENAIAGPFKGTARLSLQVTAYGFQIFKGATDVAASRERRAVTSALNALQAAEGISLKPTTESTNDMAVFPSNEYALYPVYLAIEKTEFRYLIDSNGMAMIDPADATLDPVVEDIYDRLERLER